MDRSTSESLEQLRAENQRLRAQLAALTSPAEAKPLLDEFAPDKQPVWLNVVNDAIFIADARQQIQSWNRAAEQIYGWPHALVIGQPHTAIIPVVRYNDGVDSVSVAHILATEGLWRGEVVQHARDGHELVIEASLRTFFDNRGAVVGYIGVNRDITARTHGKAALQASQALYRQIVETTQEGVWMIDPKLVITFVNPQMATMLGYTTEEMIGVPLFNFLHPAIATEVAELAPLLHEGGVGQYERLLYHKSGAEIWVHLNTNALYDQDGRYSGALAMVTDISDRKRAEAALRESEERFRTMIENGVEGIVLLDPDLQLRYVSPTVNALLGYTVESFTNYRSTDLCHPDDLPQLELFITHLIASAGATAQVVTRLRHKDGSWRWMEQHGTNQIHNPSIRAILINFYDVSERIRAEQIAAEALAQRDALISSVPNGIGYLDHTLRYVLVNPALAIINGHTPAEHLGRTFAEMFPALAAWLDPLLHQVLMTGKALSDFEVKGPLGTAAGELRDWLISIYPVPLPGDGGLGVGVTMTDLTEHKRTEAALRVSELRFHQFAEHAEDVIYRYQLRPNPQFEYLSPAAERMTGYPREAFYEDRQLTLQIIHPDDMPRLRELAHQDNALTHPITLRWRHRNGTIGWAELHSWLVVNETDQSLTLEGIARDITERRQTEEALRQSAQQLQSLSRRLVEAHEHERRHIARELHDEVGQVLTGLKLTLAVAINGEPHAHTTTLVHAQASINDLMGRVRALSLDLRPALLDDMGLLPALDWYLERYTDRTGVHVELRHQGLARRFPAEIETVAYRLIQESLTNVARHAGVTNATVRLLADEANLMLRVDDAGRGFDQAAVLAKRATGGLSGMYERVQLIGGMLTIDSVLGGGTQIIAELPLPTTEGTP